MSLSPSLEWLYKWNSCSTQEKYEAMCIEEDEDRNIILTALDSLPSLATSFELDTVMPYVKQLVLLSIQVARLQYWTARVDLDRVMHIIRQALEHEIQAHKNGTTTLYHAKHRGYLQIPLSSSPKMKCVNYSLFGNFSILGESTLHYLCFNYSTTMPECIMDLSCCGVLEIYSFSQQELSDCLVYEADPNTDLPITQVCHWNKRQARIRDHTLSIPIVLL